MSEPAMKSWLVPKPSLRKNTHAAAAAANTLSKGHLHSGEVK